MITFGELRKLSLAWQTEISAVEKIYARDWLLKAVFDRNALRPHLFLRGASALASTYFVAYPRVEDIDLGRAPSLDAATLEPELTAAIADAARASGLTFRLNTFKPTEARIEFTGPLGRRSAAQPLIIARLVPAVPRLAPVARPLLHPFSDACPATVYAITLDEFAAERIAAYSASPRARDVYDLWYILTHAPAELDLTATRQLVQTIATEKKRTPQPTLNANYAPLLERAWDNALKEIRIPSTFTQARTEIEPHLQTILAP